MAITGIRWQEERTSPTVVAEQPSLVRRGLRLLRAERRYTWVLLAMAGLGALGVAVLGVPTMGSLIGSVLLVLFMAYFIRHFSFAVAALKSGPADLAGASLPLLEDPARLPTVSVLVACKNEEAVLDRLLDGLLALEYPRDRWSGSWWTTVRAMAPGGGWINKRAARPGSPSCTVRLGAPGGSRGH